MDTVFRAAGGTVVVCTGPGAGPFVVGSLPPGDCTFSGSPHATNSGSGNGLLVPGAATLDLELKDGGGVIETFSVPITLTN